MRKSFAAVLLLIFALAGCSGQPSEAALTPAPKPAALSLDTEISDAKPTEPPAAPVLQQNAFEAYAETLPSLSIPKLGLDGLFPSFYDAADLDGDGIEETIIVARQRLPGGMAGETMLLVWDNTGTYHTYDGFRPDDHSYEDKVYLRDIDGDGYPEIILFRDISGVRRGDGAIIKFDGDTFRVLYDSAAEDEHAPALVMQPDIDVKYIAGNRIRVKSKTMKPQTHEYGFLPGEHGADLVYNDQGKLIRDDDPWLDQIHAFYPADIDGDGVSEIVTQQLCCGAGGHADTLGIVDCVYRYYPDEGTWRLIKTRFVYEGEAGVSAREWWKD